MDVTACSLYLEMWAVATAQRAAMRSPCQVFLEILNLADKAQTASAQFVQVASGGVAVKFRKVVRQL